MSALRGDRYGTSDLARLMSDVERLARPRPARARGGQLRRDPAAEWDWLYQLDDSTRRWIGRHLMVPADGHGERPDTLAAMAGFDSTDSWAGALVAQVNIARSRARDRDPFADDWADYAAEVGTDDLVGPDEVAAMLDVGRNCLCQLRHRGQLPAPDLTISRLPVWHASTVERWARDTGRELVDVVHLYG